MFLISSRFYQAQILSSANALIAGVETARVPGLVAVNPGFHLRMLPSVRTDCVLSTCVFSSLIRVASRVCRTCLLLLVSSAIHYEYSLVGELRSRWTTTRSRPAVGALGRTSDRRYRTVPFAFSGLLRFCKSLRTPTVVTRIPDGPPTAVPCSIAFSV